MEPEQIVARLECHMCDQKPKYFIGPYLWCGDQDCGEEIYELVKELKDA